MNYLDELGRDVTRRVQGEMDQVWDDAIERAAKLVKESGHPMTAAQVLMLKGKRGRDVRSP